jgi:large subunit ribosomal protein L33
MAKKNTVIVRMESSGGTGYYKIAQKNPKKQQKKMEFMHYDPVLRKHVLFVEKKYK